VPANAAGRWRWQFAAAVSGVFEATLDQTFQSGLVNRKDVSLEAFNFRFDDVCADDVVSGLRQTCAHYESNVSGSYY